MNLGDVLGLAISVLGLSKDIAKSIKEKLSKKLLVTPNQIQSTSRHWNSTNSVIVQNTTERPMFSVQIVFWHEKNQTLNFKLENVKKEAEIEGIVINYGVVQFRGLVGEENIVILEILRLLPKESVEIDLEIEKQGSIKIFPVSYDDKQSKQVLNDKKQFAYPFTAPFNYSMTSISLNLRRRT